METTPVIKSSAFNRRNAFIGLFGVSMAAFAAGFGDCLFDIDKADACVAHAEGWVDDFKAVGDHLIAWASAIVKAALN